jgi:hypothetical protein
VTLTTAVRLAGAPLQHARVWQAAREIIGATGAGYRFTLDRRPKFGDNPIYRAEPGQGLPALLVLSYGADGPLIDVEDSEVPPPPPGLVEVVFDTAYGGGDSSDDVWGMHQGYVAELADWAARIGATVHWHDEFTGHWHPAT